MLLCRQTGAETGMDIEKLVECARFAETIVSHPLPRKPVNSSLDRRVEVIAA